MGLGYYKWHQSQVSSGVLARTLGLNGSSNGIGVLQMALELGFERCASEDIGPQREWIVRSHIGWRGEQNIPYKSTNTSPCSPWQKHLKTVKLTRNRPKRTISNNSGLELLQGQYLIIVGLSYHKWYQSQVLRCVPTRTLGPQ